jgi:hypothetical protein
MRGEPGSATSEEREVAPMEIDTSGWSGEGAFTGTLVEVLKTLDGIEFLRVEDGSGAGPGAGYNFISNEVYVRFAGGRRAGKTRRFGIVSLRRRPAERVGGKGMALAGLEAQLASIAEIGAADYVDGGMVQYLRTERIIPPYQTRGYKLVEMVRIYEAGNEPHERPPDT